MNWKMFVVLARGLAKQSFEASQRAAVSCAYYGAFNLARRWLEANVTPIDDRRAHAQVWRTFENAGRATDQTRPQWRKIGRLGNSLRAFRNQVDYDDEVDLSRRAAPRAVETAEHILELLDELRTEVSV